MQRFVVPVEKKYKGQRSSIIMLKPGSYTPSVHTGEQDTNTRIRTARLSINSKRNIILGFKEKDVDIMDLLDLSLKVQEFRSGRLPGSGYISGKRGY